MARPLASKPCSYTCGTCQRYKILSRMSNDHQPSSSLRIAQSRSTRSFATLREKSRGAPETSATSSKASVASSSAAPSDPTPDSAADVRTPRAVQAAYLRPLKRQPTHGLPVCDLQLRSYSVRNVEFMSDFALRAAYYLKMPASGPVPLPRLIKRWTVPKSHFIFKKTQENFEQITLRRLIQIKDAHPETVEIWLAFLRKHAFHGVGLKANIWHHDRLGVSPTMDAISEDLQASIHQTWGLFGRSYEADKAEKVVDAMQTDKVGTAVEGTSLRSFLDVEYKERSK